VTFAGELSTLEVAVMSSSADGQGQDAHDRRSLVLQSVLDTMDTNGVVPGMLVANPLKEALDAGQVFTAAELQVVDRHFKTFLSSVGCPANQAEHDALEKKAADKYARTENEVQLRVFDEWSRLDALGLLTAETRAAVAETVWGEMKESSRLADKLEKEGEVREAEHVFRTAVPFCHNRYGKIKVPEPGTEGTSAGGALVHCGKVGMKVCAVCKIGRYCSVQCQKEHWHIHKHGCSA